MSAIPLVYVSGCLSMLIAIADVAYIASEKNEFSMNNYKKFTILFNNFFALIISIFLFTKNV